MTSPSHFKGSNNIVSTKLSTLMLYLQNTFFKELKVGSLGNCKPKSFSGYFFYGVNYDEVKALLDRDATYTVDSGATATTGVSYYVSTETFADCKYKVYISLINNANFIYIGLNRYDTIIEDSEITLVTLTYGSSSYVCIQDAYIPAPATNKVWNTKQDGTGTYYYTGDLIYMDKDLTIYEID